MITVKRDEFAPECEHYDSDEHLVGVPPCDLPPFEPVPVSCLSQIFLSVAPEAAKAARDGPPESAEEDGPECQTGRERHQQPRRFSHRRHPGCDASTCSP